MKLAERVLTLIETVRPCSVEVLRLMWRFAGNGVRAVSGKNAGSRSKELSSEPSKTT